MKLACVVQRYGPEITGGSESHCRQIAERLGARHDVHVLTSTAHDYVSWREGDAPGWTTAGPVRVRRFPVVGQRGLRHFAEVSDRAFSRRSTAAEQREWFEENGPRVPALVEYLREHGRDYDFVLFWAFRYYQSYFGVPVVADRAVLVPTAEDDEVVRFPILREYFQLPRGYVFLTEEERALVASRAGGRLAPSVVVGTGLEPRRPSAAAALGGLDLPAGFLLYVGRVDVNKGCAAMLGHFTRYLERGGPAITLVLAGPVHMPVAPHPHVRVLGFVSDEVREALLDRATALMMPSPYESLSIALLEGWNHGRPAIVNGRCDVLRGQVRRAGGGLYYTTSREFEEAVRLVLERPDLAARLGAGGESYVEAEYRWPLVLHRIEALLESLREAP
jgi:glycosyltransferase involved in cell wall biosynthesis